MTYDLKGYQYQIIEINNIDPIITNNVIKVVSRCIFYY